ncbi:unnamed protein product [Tuber melanosporum]|uniref:(Perigord truffle) hypothetical protein n=1 Tax=Tuber melanosporum (strain Mel28) TaxID=656061 RepID=D5GDA4_TUBMM|nr:uncharacterized protein GSTUM_00006122001 [Tuber melanosporum]KAG0135113.1 hypothetical protein HOY82DRAFT_155021 [Tuber indicum]CAZ82497.1 unnamed protein product [Tuber melanosporum]
MSRLWRFPVPKLPSSAVLRTAGVYTSGALFSLGFFLLLDASVYSKHANGGDVHITIVDWIPLICSILGMLVINSIERSRLVADSYSYSGNGVAWKAKLVLFMGFALMAGGLAGAATVLIMKYVVPAYPWPTLGFGVAGVVGSACVMLSSVVLWVSQNIEEDYTYNLSL